MASIIYSDGYVPTLNNLTNRSREIQVVKHDIFNNLTAIERDVLCIAKEILKLLKANGKLIINCGEGAIKNVRESNLLESYKFIYQQKVGINWFNFHLKNTFLKNL